MDGSPYEYECDEREARQAAAKERKAKAERLDKKYQLPEFITDQTVRWTLLEFKHRMNTKMTDEQREKILEFFQRGICSFCGTLEPCNCYNDE